MYTQSWDVYIRKCWNINLWVLYPQTDTVTLACNSIGWWIWSLPTRCAWKVNIMTFFCTVILIPRWLMRPILLYTKLQSAGLGFLSVFLMVFPFAYTLWQWGNISSGAVHIITFAACSLWNKSKALVKCMQNSDDELCLLQSFSCPNKKFKLRKIIHLVFDIGKLKILLNDHYL